MPPSSNQTRTSEGSSCSAALNAASAADRSPRRAETWAWRWNRSGRPGRQRLRLADAVERAERVAHRQPHAGPRHQHLDVAADPARQLVGQRRRVAGPAEGEQRADLAQGGVGIVRRRRRGPRGSARAPRRRGRAWRRCRPAAPRWRRAARRGRRPGSARPRRGRAGPSRCSRAPGPARRRRRPCAGGRRPAGASSANSWSSAGGSNANSPAELVAAHLGRELGRDRDRGILVLQVDRERELLRHVERLELQRAPGLPQRAVEVAELAQHEAQVVVRAGHGRRRRPPPGRTRCAHPRSAGAPSARGRRRSTPPRCRSAPRGAPLILLERRAELAPLQEEQAQVEPGGEQRPVAVERPPEGRRSPASPAARPRAPRPDCSRPAGRPDRRATARSYEAIASARRPAWCRHTPALVPQLGRVGELAHQGVVELERRGQLAAQQVHLGHGLQGQPPVLARVQRQPVLAQRLLVQALLPEGQAQVVVRQRAALDDLRGARPRGWPRAACRSAA